MQTSAGSTLLLTAVAILLLQGGIALAFRMRPARQSRMAIAAAVLPPLLMLALFYSLAVHMYQALGAWPASIA